MGGGEWSWEVGGGLRCGGGLQVWGLGGDGDGDVFGACWVVIRKRRKERSVGELLEHEDVALGNLLGIAEDGDGNVEQGTSGQLRVAGGVLEEALIVGY